MRQLSLVIAVLCISSLTVAEDAFAKRKETVAAAPAWADVDFPTRYPTGSIVVVNKERALYFVSEEGRARRYPVAIGTSDELWTGKEVVSEMRENPRWFPLRDDDEVPEPVAGGDPRNPLGARALYLGRTLWRIHGTIVPGSIGRAVSNGCIRMRNVHVIDLFDRAAIGTEVYVVQTLSDARPTSHGKKLFD